MLLPAAPEAEQKPSSAASEEMPLPVAPGTGKELSPKESRTWHHIHSPREVDAILSLTRVPDRAWLSVVSWQRDKDRLMARHCSFYRSSFLIFHYPTHYHCWYFPTVSAVFVGR